MQCCVYIVNTNTPVEEAKSALVTDMVHCAVKDSAMIKFIMADMKIIDDAHNITQKRGNGQLRREVWVDEQGKVTRYNLAYINHTLHSDDNGRVVGYDNQHGYHHRHYFGVVAPVNFTSFEDIEDQFQTDWTALRSKA